MALLLLGATWLLGPAARAEDKVDESPLKIGVEDAFPKIRIARPVVVTHAGDGSNRLFVASQLGTIHVFPNDPAAEATQVFLDIESRVVYKDKENEEGLLGLALHPKFRENGQFFVYYTTRSAPHTSVVSRFRVSADNPNQADPDSEEELLRIPQPFWNHNGGTLVFGPDGYLYIGLGDGGAANDPQDNGQNLATWLGSILRIDVDRHDMGKAYAVPPDNPFVDRPGAQPEIWAYGLRNVWRMSFDPETGLCWAGDVGQNLWEEINLIERGGNYGWRVREGLHPFAASGHKPPGKPIDPIWEYHHDIGKSITGGDVYRGSKLPELRGAYLYGDYVSGRLWALRYDADKKRVVANHPLQGNNLPVVTFGRDEQGEVYFTTVLGGGIIYRFKRITE
ncbi:MAG: PQQ-dependent sugar dehydrogenase [Pirellulaceae bacterium]|nr:PQQ-dependent sugar dehydrogenase [Pirellulaceae bacterium]